MSEFIAPLSRLKNLQSNGMPYPSLADVLKVKRMLIVDVTDYFRFVDNGMPTEAPTRFAKGGYLNSSVPGLV